MVADSIDVLTRQGVLSPLDKHLAIALAELDARSSPESRLATALASRAVRQGHVCVQLAQLAGTPLTDGTGQAHPELSCPDLATWQRQLKHSELVSDGTRATPLVLSERGDLYLYRYYDLESRLARALLQRAGSVAVNEGLLKRSLQRLFPKPDDGSPDQQALAAIAVVTHRLSLISGGPGTGKTTTVAKILALLAEQIQADTSSEKPDKTLEILLLGPTGKATQRLASSLREGLERLELDRDLASSMVQNASTIHRALGYRPRTPTHFRRTASNPLPADVVIVDEASMVDLALMTRLVEAIRPEARLVFLGDHEQLTSVEAGSIFGDICSGAWRAAHSQQYRDLVTKLCGYQLESATQHEGNATTQAQHAPLLRDSVAHLTKNYRYGAGSEIAELARLINAGSASELLDYLSGRRQPTEQHQQVSFHPIEDRERRDATALLKPHLSAPIAEHYGAFLNASNAAEQLATLERFRILAAHREGAWGVSALNGLVERVLQPLGLDPSQVLYENRPIMVTENDYRLGFYNGDVGVIGSTVTEGKRAWFTKQAELVSVSPSRLPTHETVFAMTVHKSQGSEFDEVALVLPPSSSPLLSRELLYTAVTRAKQRVRLIASPESLSAALNRRVQRASGLSARLWQTTGTG